MTADHLVNGVYPTAYFGLPGTDNIPVPHAFWWASDSRYSAVNPSDHSQYLNPDEGGITTKEYLEIDLGRTRQINFLDLDIMRMPVDIDIEYDAVSSDDGTHKWVPVTRHWNRDMPFDDRHFFDASARNPWINAHFYFTDAFGRMVNTRFLRIRFARLHVPWPVRRSKQFRWPVIVKNMRVARYITKLGDTLAPIIDTGANTDVSVEYAFNARQTSAVQYASGIVKQKFVMPEDAKRGGTHQPNIMGFSFLAHVNSDFQKVGYRWWLYDVTDGANTLLEQGTTNNFLNTGKAWINVYLDRRHVEAADGKVYEIRVQSSNVHASSKVYLQAPNRMPVTRVEADSFEWVNGTPVVTYEADDSLADDFRQGDYVRKGSDTSAYRVSGHTWDDGDNTGEIILTRAYRGHDETTTEISKVYTFDRDDDRNSQVDLVTGAYDFTFEDDAVVAAGNHTSELAIGDYIRPTGTDRKYRIQSIAYNGGSGDTEITLGDEYDGLTVSGAEIEKITIDPTDTDDYGDIDLTHSLALRVWADVADTGRDVLGNTYRYATVRDRARLVTDDTKAGWMSAPQPTPDAVESLYFDMRTEVNGVMKSQVIDALRISPRTPGVRMHVYYTNQSANGPTPETLDQWESIVWTPVNQLYVLRGDNTLTLPSQIKATHIKLEFTNLRPLPFKIPTYPKLPPVTFRRYPTWVEVQFEDPLFNGYQRFVEDWFLLNRTATMNKMLQTITGTDEKLLEFQYKQREFLAFLALGKTGRGQGTITWEDKNGKPHSRYIDIRNQHKQWVDYKTRTFIDPVTKSKIAFSTTDMYRTPLMGSVDQSSILGKFVASNFDARLLGNPSEGEVNFSGRFMAGNVSSVNDRVQETYSFLARTPMWFNKKALHKYKIEQAQFNRKAYFVGISEVEFLRADYRIPRDDKIIDDVLHDSLLLETDPDDPSTPWERDEATAIVDGQTVYVTYQVGEDTYTDEEVTLVGSSSEVLLGKGDVATHFTVRSHRLKQGTFYGRGEDYDITSTYDEFGEIINLIQRSTVSNRLMVRRDPTTGYTRDDGAVVSVFAQPSGLDVLGASETIIVGITPSGIEEYSSTLYGLVSVTATPVTTAEDQTVGYNTGSMEWWNNGETLFPYTIPDDPETGSMTFWHEGDPLPPHE